MIKLLLGRRGNAKNEKQSEKQRKSHGKASYERNEKLWDKRVKEFRVCSNKVTGLQNLKLEIARGQ